MTYKKTEPFEGSAFPLRVTVQKRQGILVNPHWHEHLEVMQVLAGRVRVQVNGKRYEGQAGDIFFVNSNALHGVEALEAEAELLGVVWDIRLTDSFMEEVELQHLYHLLLRSEVDPVLARARQPEWEVCSGTLQELRREYEGGGLGYRTAIKSHVFRLIREQLRKLQSTAGLMKMTREYERLRPAIALIEQGYSGRLPLQEVAGTAGLSLFHFCRLFKRVMNRTVQQFVQEVRLREARRLLRDTDLPVAELSERVGYGNPNYFARVFREHTGTTPLRMRKQYQDMKAAGQHPHEPE
ncbi:helix-turn-helix domain-containing protein [Paenibacillus mesotrionivorans]|uniref:Helix-turn-helix domain-containing protein n=1 Tax=Paenibacillus mesotrionivorans TaxID=3160968 RepID=A0ACC7NTG8_9BACL